ncbi:hypothetical protein DN389_04870 [Bacillus sp. AY3-1]|nr:hypothetical protein DN389_04870 [Bacillus sp. AY3-1]
MSLGLTNCLQQLRYGLERLYLFIKGKVYVASLIPAIFMTLMTVVYILTAIFFMKAV